MYISDLKNQLELIIFYLKYVLFLNNLMKPIFLIFDFSYLVQTLIKEEFILNKKIDLRLICVI